MRSGPLDFSLKVCYLVYRTKQGAQLGLMYDASYYWLACVAWAKPEYCLVLCTQYGAVTVTKYPSLYKTILGPWEYVYVQGLPGFERVPWDDTVAFGWYPEYRYLYDKLWLAREQAQDVRESGYAPPGWFIRPRVNLLGMGRGTYKAGVLTRIPEGCFAHRPLEGTHISTDFVLVGGKVRDFFTFQAHYEAGSFSLFESVPGRYNAQARQFVEAHVTHGVVNVESIGETIIEVHLRPSLQFYDISGGLLPNLPLLYGLGDWPFMTSQEKTYSRVIRRPTDAVLTHYPKFDRLLGVRSVQFCYWPGMPLSAAAQDSSSFRVAVVNGSDLEAVEEMAQAIRAEVERLCLK